MDNKIKESGQNNNGDAMETVVDSSEKCNCSDKAQTGEHSECACQRKLTDRSDDEVKNLTFRINRMTGQLCGIKKMIEENRYCKDVLIQVAAVEAALHSFGLLVLKEHMESCVATKIQRGEMEVIDETIEIIKRLK